MMKSQQKQRCRCVNGSAVARAFTRSTNENRRLGGRRFHGCNDQAMNG